jgi:BolA protein
MVVNHPQPTLGPTVTTPDTATVERIRALVQDALRPESLVIRDDSDAHAGHTSAGGRGHYRLHIVSERFVGLSRLERHRLVNATLAELFDSHIHALALRTDAPNERR